MLWGIILGAYVWIGLLAIGIGGGSAFLFGLVAAVLIFFFVRLCGEDQLRSGLGAERQRGAAGRWTRESAHQELGEVAAQLELQPHAAARAVDVAGQPLEGGEMAKEPRDAPALEVMSRSGIHGSPGIGVPGAPGHPWREGRPASPAGNR